MLLDISGVGVELFLSAREYEVHDNQHRDTDLNLLRVVEFEDLGLVRQHRRSVLRRRWLLRPFRRRVFPGCARGADEPTVLVGSSDARSDGGGRGHLGVGTGRFGASVA